MRRYRVSLYLLEKIPYACLLLICHSKTRAKTRFVHIKTIYTFLGRTSIVAVRVGNSVVRIQVPRRTIAVVSIATETKHVFTRFFNQNSIFQRLRSQCLACYRTFGFLYLYILILHILIGL